MANKIGIITINFNHASGLERTMQSVLQQDFKDFEYIVIDGGSSDGSKKIIETHHAAISAWRSEPDAGIYDAMNKGIALATADYLLFLNSGDTLTHPKILSEVAQYLNDGIDIVYGNLNIEENGKRSQGFMPDAIDLDQMMRDTLWHPVSFIKRDLFIRFGNYDTQFKIVGDYDFFFRVIISKAVSTKHIGVFVAVFSIDGLSSDPANAPRINAEKEIARRKYLTEAQISNYHLSVLEKEQLKKKKKTSFFRKWFRL
jgi:glycosyltransferase involved in cell wall biosynthesis